MPLNCPLGFSICDSFCRYWSEDKCWWYFPARDLSEIFTPNERLNALEAKQKVDRGFVPKVVLSAQWDEIRQLEGLVKFLQKKLNEHVDAPRRRAKTKARIKTTEV